MKKRRARAKLRIVRSAIREDLLQFVFPAIMVFFIELLFCANGLERFWGTIWDLIKNPQNLFLLPLHSVIGLTLVGIGFGVLLLGQITLGLNHSSTVVIREKHQLITHGIYRFTRNPMYLGVILVVIGLPVYVASLSGFLTALVLIPLFLNRIRLEERLLVDEYKDAYEAYRERTKKLIPFVY